jgi:D-alanine-D-alanine ligase-like ATP-grasp enzyme
MYRLNTHPGLLEVMGAPLVGSPVQASVLTGGNLAFKGLRPRLHSKRIQMICEHGRRQPGMRMR